MTQKQYKLFNVIISRNIMWPILGLWGKRESFFLENFLTCGNLSTWIRNVSVILAKKFGQNLFRKIRKSDKFVMGGELVLMGIPGLLKGSYE